MFRRRSQTQAPGSAEVPGKVRRPSNSGRAENPYLENKVTDDDRYMNLAAEKHNWQVAWRLTFGLLVVVCGLNGNYMLSSKYVPYVTSVDRHGNVIVVGPADKLNQVDSKRILRKEVLNWIEASRMVVGDQLAQKRLIEQVYARVANNGKAKKMLDDYYKDRKVFETAQTLTASAEIKVALPTSNNSWQIEWVEKWRNAEGAIVREENWKAHLTFEVTPLDDERGIDRNPAGFFVTDFAWSKQI